MIPTIFLQSHKSSEYRVVGYNWSGSAEVARTGKFASLKSICEEVRTLPVGIYYISITDTTTKRSAAYYIGNKNPERVIDEYCDRLLAGRG